MKNKIYIAMSLDGYIADKQGMVDWLHEVEGKGDNGYQRFYKSIDTIVMGHKTYDQIISFDVDYPYLEKRNIVFSSHLIKDKNIEVFNGNIEKFIKKYEKKLDQVWIVGGANVINQFLVAHKIEAIIIAVIPIILGEGIKLFNLNKTIKLKLNKIEKYGQIAFLDYLVKHKKPII